MPSDILLLQKLEDALAFKLVIGTNHSLLISDAGTNHNLTPWENCMPDKHNITLAYTGAGGTIVHRTFLRLLSAATIV